MAASEPEEVYPLRHRLRVGEHREIAPAVYYLCLESGPAFLPGQSVSVGLEPDGPARYYSVASGSEESGIAILYDRVEGGALTPRLSRCEVGDTLWVSEAFGSFTDDPEADAMWIATGTGVAPFLSMARSFASGRLGSRKRLIHGGRSLERFYFARELAGLLGDSYLRCCSRCDPSAGQDAVPANAPLYPGRLTRWLEERIAAGELDTGSRYMLCGSSAMVVQVRDLLIRGGVPFARIHAEIYF
jgi:ferredoxin-NADP reductase